MQDLEAAHEKLLEGKKQLAETKAVQAAMAGKDRLVQQFDSSGMDDDIREASTRIEEKSKKILERVTKEKGGVLQAKGERLLSIAKSHLGDKENEGALEQWRRQVHTLVMENCKGETLEMLQGVIDAGLMSDEGITQLNTLGTSLLGASKSGALEIRARLTLVAKAMTRDAENGMTWILVGQLLEKEVQSDAKPTHREMSSF